ncbi:hypothetical protein [Streptomyces sp. NPDC001658]
MGGHIQRYGECGEDLEYDQYRAAVLPMAGHMRDVLVCELDRPAADERDGRTSPFLGLSGAPVFAGAVLLGVVTHEERYAADLRSQYRKTEIFGIDELGRSEASWDLDTAYLSLEADGSRESATPAAHRGGCREDHARLVAGRLCRRTALLTRTSLSSTASSPSSCLCARCTRAAGVFRRCRNCCPSAGSSATRLLRAGCAV